jgi:8-oxo-dGTP pyrophosphatase MutT (NUDIX family)
MEVLLLQRNSRGQFENMWVFPGGRVDPDDFGSVVGDDAEVEMGAARAAAVREATEEASLDLNPSDLVPFSFWVPPLGGAKRFATWFFLIEVRNDASAVVIDQLEIHRSEWMTPATAIAVSTLPKWSWRLPRSRPCGGRGTRPTRKGLQRPLAHANRSDFPPACVRTAV